jgi:hypothetical protein
MPNWLKWFVGKRYNKPKGVLLFDSVQEVILVNHLLTGLGFQVRLVAPPPEVRVGCDLAVEFELLEQEAIETTLKRTGNVPQKMVSTKEMLPDILKQSSFTEIGGYIMCKTGNMKITVDKHEHRIVNISGGGCPDIPYVARELYNVRIEDAENPIDIGNSLCSYMLQISFDTLKKRLAIS